MSELPIFDETCDATLLDPQLSVPAFDRVAQQPATQWMYVPAHLAGPCEDRPPHQLTDNDGIE